MKTMSLDGFIAELRVMRLGMARTETRGLRFGAEIIQKEAQERIGHENEDWAALSERTVAEKSAQGFTGRISPTDPLYRTGDLKKSISVSVSGLHAQIGSPLQVAVYQELGTPNAKYPIPPRWFLGAAAFTKGREAAKAAGLEVAKLVAGKPVSRD